MQIFPTNEFFDQAPGGILIYGSEGLRYANPSALLLLTHRSFSLAPGDPIPPIFSPAAEACAATVITVGASTLQVFPRRLSDGILLELHPQPPEEHYPAEAFRRLSGQLRSPLSQLMGTLELLPQMDDPLEQGDLLAKASRSLCQLLRLTNRLELYGKLSQSEPVTMHQHALSPLCQELCWSLDSLLVPMQIRVQYEAQATPTVLCAPSLLRNLLLQLISNSIAAGATQLTLTLAATKTTARLTLVDNGSGLPLHRLDTAFSPAQASNDLSENGMNLGLSLCQKIAQLHKGTFLLSPQPEGGTLCSLTLPLAPRNTPEVHAPQEDTSGGLPDYLVELSDVLSFDLFHPDYFG